MKTVLKLLYNRIYPSYHYLLMNSVKNMDSLLDVGCGTKSPLQFISNRGFSVGFDVHRPSIEESRKKGIHDEYIEGSINQLSSIFSDDQFDYVIANDVIEHLTPEAGILFLDQLERIARKRVVIFTPSGFVPQKAYDGNPWMEHLSGWDPEFFLSRGYVVHGVNGLKYLRGERRKIKYKPIIFFKFLAWVSQYIVYKHPKYAFAQFAVLTK